MLKMLKIKFIHIKSKTLCIYKQMIQKQKLDQIRLRY